MSNNSLENWRKWLQERQRLQNHLAKCLDRLPGDLVMNLDEEVRGIREEKTLIGYTEIETEVDKFRGSPSFWKAPWELVFRKNRNEKSYLFKKETLEEKGIVPDVECVRIPRRILEEKHVFPRTRSLWTQWNKLEYRKLKMMQLQEKLERIQPHRPEFDNLIVVGNKIEVCETKDSDDGSTISNDESVEEIVAKPKGAIKSRRIVLQTPFIINDCYFLPNELNTIKSFVIAFPDFNVKSKQCATKFLTFENKSTTPLKLSFHPSEPYNLFHDLIPYRKQGIAFFFKRDDIFLMPGQKLEHPIRFKTSKPGNYSEIWEITTTPKLWREPAKVIVKLKGFADVTTMEKCKELANELEKLVEDGVVKDIISELMHNVNEEIKSETLSFLHYYDEAKLFETINSQITPYRNTPKYKYNRNIVEKLKQLFESARNEQGKPAQWNYSLEGLRSLLVSQPEALQECDELINHLDAPFPPTCNGYNTSYITFFAFLNAAITESCNEIHKLQEDLGIIVSSKYPTTILPKTSFIEKRPDTKRRSSKDSHAKLVVKKTTKTSLQKLIKRGSVDSKTRKSKASIFSVKPDEEKPVDVKIPDHLATQYKHNLYVIFYTNLCKTVDAIETAVASQEAELPHRSLQTIQECKTFDNKYYNSKHININTLIAEILKPAEPTEKLVTSTVGTRQISYPETLFLPRAAAEVTERGIRSTSTLEGGKLDPNWLDLKEIAAQTSRTSREFDLVQQVEVLQEATSLQDVEFSREVGCQKEQDEHVSDEEHFYSSGDEK